MSVITYKDKIIACDSQVSNNNMSIGEVNKIQTLDNDIILGLCGDSDSREVAKIFEKVTSEKDLPTSKELLETDCDCKGIVIFPSGELFEIEIALTGDKRKYASVDKITRPFHAIGSGEKIALGAMAAGASAIEAIEIACKYDVWCGLPIHFTKLEYAKGNA